MKNWTLEGEKLAIYMPPLGPLIMASQSEAANFFGWAFVETPVSIANLQFQTSQKIFTLLGNCSASYKVQFTGHFCAAGVTAPKV
jgi:hypothetical protein